MKGFISAILRISGIAMIIVGILYLIQMLDVPKSVDEMHIISVGTKEDADCTILSGRGYTIMIDTGEEEDAEHILEILEEMNINNIDCLIFTHPDKDHIGGSLELIDNISIDLVIEPYYNKGNKVFEAVQRKIKDKNIKELVLSRRRNLQFGDMQLIVYPPDEFSYNKNNNYSLAVKLEHKNTELFFAGDAEVKRINEILKLPVDNVDFYKIAYHGREVENSIKLLEKLSPEIAVVSAEKAYTELENTCTDMGVDVYYTVNNDVFFISDGEHITKDERK